jgi:hypothetical protein
VKRSETLGKLKRHAHEPRQGGTQKVWKTSELAEKGTIRVDLYQGTACLEVRRRKFTRAAKRLEINRALAQCHLLFVGLSINFPL